MDQKIKIALLGLSRVGEIFSEHFLEKIQEQHIRVEIVAVATHQLDSPVALGFAHSNIPVFEDALKVVDLGDKVDIIFDLTGNAEVRRQLRAKMQATGNQHTVIAPEIFAQLLWEFFNEGEALPHSAKMGYK
ncbi:MAG TPA: homoserine dehydrogenase [Burkholderiales bacterium]|nr:homoserine dehydrogenase [Burkholderiales bacterium]